MKRPIFVLAVTLILVVAFGSGAFASTIPINYQNPAWDDGDDHTWGGENNVSPNGPGLTSTGIVVLDLLIYRLFLYNSDLTDKSGDRVVLIGHFQSVIENTQTEQDEAILSNKGN